jgi:hypothetical protein
MRRGGEMRAVGFEAGKLLVIVAVYIEDRNGASEFQRRIHERRGYGDNSTDFLGMTRCEQLHRSRSAREAGKENSLSVRVFSLKHIVKNRHQIPFVIDG